MRALGVSLALLWLKKMAMATPTAEQDASNAKHCDRQQPQLIFKEVTTERTSENSERDKRNDACRKPFLALAIRPDHILETRFSCRGSEREPYGSEEFFVVKRFGQEGRSSCVQSGGTNQRIVLSRKDDDARRRRNFAKLRLNFQAAHLGHTNIDQRNRWAMSLRIAQELPRDRQMFLRPDQPTRKDGPIPSAPRDRRRAGKQQRHW